MRHSETARLLAKGVPVRRGGRVVAPVALLGVVALVVLSGTRGDKGRPLEDLSSSSSSSSSSRLSSAPLKRESSRRLERYVLNGTATVCNDGSPAVYYFGRSPSRSNVWLLYLRGGGWCSTLDECMTRAADKTSSTSTPPSIDAPLGSLWHELPSSPLAGANVVYLHYCSSDAFLGSEPASDRTKGLAFRGRDILDAAVDQIVHAHGLFDDDDDDDDSSKKNDREAPFVVFAGSSAGGRGVVYNANRIVARLQGEGPLLGAAAILDSSVWVDAPRVEASVANFADLVRPETPFFELSSSSSSSSKGSSCASTTAWWEKCLVTEHAIADLEMPVAMFSLQYDRVGIATLFYQDHDDADKGKNKSHGDPYDISAVLQSDVLLDGAARYRKALLDLQARLRRRATRRGEPFVFYSPACWGHDVFHENDLLFPHPDVFDGVDFYLQKKSGGDDDPQKEDKNSSLHGFPTFIGPEYRLRTSVANGDDPDFSFGTALDRFLDAVVLRRSSSEGRQWVSHPTPKRVNDADDESDESDASSVVVEDCEAFNCGQRCLYIDKFAP